LINWYFLIETAKNSLFISLCYINYINDTYNTF
jgi:hypothetical protein